MTKPVIGKLGKTKNAPITISESALQKQCVRWFRLKYPKYKMLLVAIPNGARLWGNKEQRYKQWNKLQAEGAVKGASDLMLLIPSGDFAGLAIEMKTKAKHSKQQPAQKAFEEAVIEAGYGYAIPRTFEQFKKVVKNYLETGKY